MKKAELEAEREKAVKRAKQGAYHFLVFGDDDSEHLPAYDGRPWDRNYDPVPLMNGLVEALPGSPTLPAEEYIGTGIGLLYDLADEYGNGEHLAWQLAGWNLPASTFPQSSLVNSQHGFPPFHPFKKERN